MENLIVIYFNIIAIDMFQNGKYIHKTFPASSGWSCVTKVKIYTGRP